MTTTNKPSRMQVPEARLWIDDPLDLCNYAAVIGDTAWQTDLMRALADRERSHAVFASRSDDLQEVMSAIVTKMAEAIPFILPESIDASLQIQEDLPEQ